MNHAEDFFRVETQKKELKKKLLEKRPIFFVIFAYERLTDQFLFKNKHFLFYFSVFSFARTRKALTGLLSESPVLKG